ncbi:DUF3761 domain-containing protein [Rhodococcus qingshengii]|uniref:DUF3761 domain-containing protein n=1 Tax=Rhodococcus qingshengii TaxID=334542 RepID=UPI0037C61217
MATFLILVGLIALVIGVIALLRGHIGWARIPNRRTAVIVSLVAFGVMLTGGALTPTPATSVSDRHLTTSTSTPPPPTSTSTTTARKTTTTTTVAPTTTPPPAPTTTSLAPAPIPSTEVAIAPFVPPAPEPAPAPAPEYTAPPAPSRGTTGGGTSGGGWDDCIGGYINTAGNCIPSPQHAPQAPAGATAQCNDGTYSFSQSRRGTCSRHGGVASWL